MRVNPEFLAAEAEATGFRIEMLEKSVRLLTLLNAFCEHPQLAGKLALKGGTALNLFVFDVPRLSVDIDLNYVGAVDRDAMLKERPRIESAIEAVVRREDLVIRRMPDKHAGGKWLLRYEDASGQSARLEVDLNFMYRVPLWPVTVTDSRALGIWRATNIPLVDLHELAAGKLSALLSRRSARDLFDSRLILAMDDLQLQRLRLAFVVYGAMDRKDWRTVSVASVAMDIEELINQLVPLLPAGEIGRREAAMQYGQTLVEECRQRLSAVLPFTENGREFLDMLLDHGEIDASVLTTDTALQERIQVQPLLQWKALNVRRHRLST